MFVQHLVGTALRFSLYRISETFTSSVSKIKIYELFSGFSEVKMSLKTAVSTSLTGPLQVVQKLSKWRSETIGHFDNNLLNNLNEYVIDMSIVRNSPKY